MPSFRRQQKKSLGVSAGAGGRTSRLVTLVSLLVGFLGISAAIWCHPHGSESVYIYYDDDEDVKEQDEYEN